MQTDGKDARLQTWPRHRWLLWLRLPGPAAPATRGSALPAAARNRRTEAVNASTAARAFVGLPLRRGVRLASDVAQERRRVEVGDDVLRLCQRPQLLRPYPASAERRRERHVLDRPAKPLALLKLARPPTERGPEQA